MTGRRAATLMNKYGFRYELRLKFPLKERAFIYQISSFSADGLQKVSLRLLLCLHCSLSLSISVSLSLLKDAFFQEPRTVFFTRCSHNRKSGVFESFWMSVMDLNSIKLTPKSTAKFNAFLYLFLQF